VKLTVPEQTENHMAHNKIVWEYHMGELMKTERVLEGNLYNLFAIRMSPYDSGVKNCVERSTEYANLEEELNSMKLLAMIKQLEYTGGTHDMNI